MIVFAFRTSIATWTGFSIVNLTANTASDSFSTTVVGATSNAADSLLTIGSNHYNEYNITAFQEGPNGGDPNTNSTVALTVGGFVPGEWAAFMVTITDTGQAALGFTNYQVFSEFNAAGGSYTFPAPYKEGPVGPHTVTGTWDFGPAGFNYGTTTASFLPTFISYITTNVVGDLDTWTGDNVYIGPTMTLPAMLTTGQSFSYYIYIGLGTNAPYGIPGDIYIISIPLTAMP
jgi:hypothetical protein